MGSRSPKVFQVSLLLLDGPREGELMVFHHAQPGREFLVAIRFGVSKMEEATHPFAPDYMLETQTERSSDSLCYSNASLEDSVCQGTQTQPEDGIEKCTETAIVFTKDACL